MIIDFHTHIVSPRIKENRADYVKRDSCFAMLYSSPEARLATAEDLIANMDKDEVDISIILNYGWATSDLYFETNDYILESVARYPKRLVGFCNTHFGSPEKALREIERCARGGARGIGELRPDIQKLDLADKEAMKPFVDTLKKHNLILLTHSSEPVGHMYPGKGSVTPEVLYPFIANFPDLKIVCAHWGGGLPFYALMPEVKKSLSNVYFDSAASPFLYKPQIYNEVCQVVGADKILFGTDYPLLTPGRLLKEIKALDLPGEAEQLILSGNAGKLLGIGEA